MLGNCATGSESTVMHPTITMRMEITMATMGRLMKNFDMGLPILCLRAKRLGVYSRARAYFLNAFGDDSFAGIQPFGNNPLGANAITDRDRSNAHFVVGSYNGNLVTALEFRHCALRNK